VYEVGAGAGAGAGAGVGAGAGAGAGAGDGVGVGVGVDAGVDVHAAGTNRAIINVKTSKYLRLIEKIPIIAFPSKI
jgi:hypothetical protein